MTDSEFYGIALIKSFVNFNNIFRKHFIEEFKNACGKTLFESFVHWQLVYLVKMISFN